MEFGHAASDIPQESILGALLLIISINDLDYTKTCGIVKFPDATTSVIYFGTG